jgi:CDP-4-dehydro-6-deoxyglucose reductase
MTLVTIDVSREVAASYVSPGQYVEVRTSGETGYFVLAGALGARPWELVMRAGGGVSDVLLAAPVGVDVEVSLAIGEGFPMDEARGRPVVIALSGTGIAAGRPIVRRRVVDGDAAITQVYVGARTEAELALREDLAAWREAGVPVVVCLSQGDQPSGEERARGYVQDVIRARTPPGGWRKSHVFAVGVASMVDALRALAPDLGLPPERVLTNH